MNIRIFLVENTENTDGTIQDFLEANGYQIVSAQNLKTAVKKYTMERNEIDLILADLNGMDSTAKSILPELKKKADVPILILAPREESKEIQEDITIGAGQYLVKPFSLKLMKANIDAILSHKGKAREVVRDGEIEVDISARMVTCGGEEVSLTRKEYDLLLYFMRHKGVVLNRSAIIDSIWGYDYLGEARTVDTFVKQLRRKLPANCDCIHTVYGIGYVWDNNN